jgi:hypothetical protein
MQFPFTFSLHIPGLHNPFLAKPGPAPAHARIQGSTNALSRLPPRFPANSLSPPVPLARKRGWIPSEPGPSHAATFATSTSGYLDTPAKYRDVPLREPEQEVEEMIAGASSCAHIPYPPVTSPLYVIPLHIPRGHQPTPPFIKRKRTIFSLSYSPSFIHALHLQLAHRYPCRTTSRKAAPHPRWFDRVHSAERCPDRHRSWPHCISTVRSQFDPSFFFCRSTVP